MRSQRTDEYPGTLSKVRLNSASLWEVRVFDEIQITHLEWTIHSVCSGIIQRTGQCSFCQPFCKSTTDGLLLCSNSSWTNADEESKKHGYCILFLYSSNLILSHALGQPYYHSYACTSRMLYKKLWMENVGRIFLSLQHKANQSMVRSNLFSRNSNFTDRLVVHKQMVWY